MAEQDVDGHAGRGASDSGVDSDGASHEQIIDEKDRYRKERRSLQIARTTISDKKQQVGVFSIITARPPGASLRPALFRLSRRNITAAAQGNIYKNQRVWVPGRHPS